jgi:hypothetical protein
MGWSETHRYYAALRTIEAELDDTMDGTVPWREEYAAIFGSPANLLASLRTRWARLVQAQVDGDTWSTKVDELARAHPGLVRVLLRADLQTPAPCEVVVA